MNSAEKNNRKEDKKKNNKEDTKTLSPQKRMNNHTMSDTTDDITTWSKCKKKRWRKLQAKMKKMEQTAATSSNNNTTNANDTKKSNEEKGGKKRKTEGKEEEAKPLSKRQKRKQVRKQKQKERNQKQQQQPQEINDNGDGSGSNNENDDDNVNHEKKQLQQKQQQQEKQKQERDLKEEDAENAENAENEERSPIINSSNNHKSKKASALQESFKARLTGSRFRSLNEELYTTTSLASFTRFSQNPELYHQYHEGFRYQVNSWPINPVDAMYDWLVSNPTRTRFIKDQTTMKKGKKQETENDKTKKKIVVADFGCGDAELAKRLLKFTSSVSNRSSDDNSNLYCPFTVHSFDLVAADNQLVTACDMANVPLKRHTVDIAVFCLSLMGTNLPDFIREAHRVLKHKGILKIAEVRSRFEEKQQQEITSRSSSKPEKKKKNKHSKKQQQEQEDASSTSLYTLTEFINVLDLLGFECIQTDRSNKLFVMLELKKNGRQPDPNYQYTAKPCIYKRR